MVWNRRLLERYWTSMAGMYSGESKPLPTRSAAAEDDADAEGDRGRWRR